jgi:CelD/BcsL family acetyltransferase involved in cellulose biosynthesis
VARAELIDTAEAAEAVVDEWDALAVLLARPFCSPAWMLAWWRNAASDGSQLRIVLVREGDELLGIAPLYVEGGDGPVRYRLLGSETASQAEPMSRPGAEETVARVVADVLSEATPRPDVIVYKNIRTDSPWPTLLADAWRGKLRPALYRSSPIACPTLTLGEGTYQEWFTTIDSHLRRELRRRRRRLEEEGAVCRLAGSPEAAVDGLRAFASLHYGRWDWRGGSGALDPSIERMLVEVAQRLVKAQRFRLWSIDVNGDTISSQVFIGAGGELAYWLGGFDESWGRYGPSVEAVRAAIEHAWEHGDERVSFGPGGQSYKYSFADGEEMLQSVEILPRTIRYPATLLRLLPARIRSKALLLRHRAFNRLSQGTKQRLKRVLVRARKRT